MKIKLDENLPAQLADNLRALGHDVQTVPEEGLAGHLDADVWSAAQNEQRFLLTQDLDFSNVTSLCPARTLASWCCVCACRDEWHWCSRLHVCLPQKTWKAGPAVSLS